jgi:hypothetical protein
MIEVNRICEFCKGSMILISSRIGMVDLGENPCKQVSKWMCLECGVTDVQEKEDEGARARVQKQVNKLTYYLNKP